MRLILQNIDFIPENNIIPVGKSGRIINEKIYYCLYYTFIPLNLSQK
jgi:hypothetical protein